MIHISDPSACCGCTACASICPRDAITMEPDALGFVYPKVNEDKCIECGLCEKVCAFNDHYDTSLNFTRPLAYGGRHKDMNQVETSQSGAAFIAPSDYILEQGGVVYGVGYKDHFRVCHKRATTKEERDEFKRSKYVQSDMDIIFRQVKRDLQAGLTVLFSGTPCQTAGLNAFVGKRLRERLFLVDIVCHGVPGPYIWRDYLNYLEKKHKSPIVWVNFRDKQLHGWDQRDRDSHLEIFKFLKKECKISFRFIFYQTIMFRHSCSVCHYCNTRRPSDITIADFWGFEKTNPEFSKDNKGVSLILINTQKGSDLFEAVKERFYYFPAKLENVLQAHLCKPHDIHPRRMAFEKDFAAHGFEYACKRNALFGWRYYKMKVFRKLHKLKNKLLHK